ncbi:MAG: sigma 54-interacting transcriptional regulator [Myxococcota bacterium]
MSVLDVLTGIDTHSQSAPDLDALLSYALRRLESELGWRRPVVALVDPARNELTIEASLGLTPAEARRARWALGEGYIGKVATHGESVVVPADDAGILDRTGAGLPKAGHTFVVVPLVGPERPLGVLAGFRPAEDPVSPDEALQQLQLVAALLVARVRDTVEQRRERPSEVPRHRFQPRGILGTSRAMRDVFELVGRVAASPTTVLLRGESGTGKELVARALHEHSPRSAHPFVAVNCAALPEALVEAEMFGHERGAFTGAEQRRLGRFEAAHEGTLFLDEIGDLPLPMQVKLLRVIQSRVIERLGSTRSVDVDVRLVAATSRDLESMVANGTFREDLYYRLNVFPIGMPPLRDRKSDVLLLADHFVETFNRSHGKGVKRLSTPAIDMLMAYHWPGNVRELENCIERAVLMARDDVILGHHLPPSLQLPDHATSDAPLSLPSQLDRFEQDLIVDALKASRGNMAKAARALAITERQMGLRVRKYDIDLRTFKSSSPTTGVP